jgi:sugar lactone lactonase YvrE
MVITPDGRTLIVAESMANRLTAFSIGARGELTEQRLWAELGSATADGICLDAEGAVWVASPPTSEVVRVTSDGSITHRVPVLDQAIACMLGGPNRRTLFVLSAPLRRAEKNRALLRGRIGTVLVDVAGAGLP